jgi:hypothetical protein
MGKWDAYIGLDLKVVFEDGKEISIRKGVFSHVIDDILFLRTDFGEEGIPFSRVIRLEFKKGEDYGAM